MFKSFSKAQVIESLAACKELLTEIIEKGNLSFDNEDINTLNCSIETIEYIMNDYESEGQISLVYSSMEKAKAKLHTQKIKIEASSREVLNKKDDLSEGITFLGETIELVKNSD